MSVKNQSVQAPTESRITECGTNKQFWSSLALNGGVRLLRTHFNWPMNLQLFEEKKIYWILDIQKLKVIQFPNEFVILSTYSIHSMEKNMMKKNEDCKYWVLGAVTVAKWTHVSSL